ncbi:MAG: MFS transporter [Acetobacteraceae bacterium]
MIARAPLFLYIFAEQLSTSFIPLYARSVFHPGGLVPEQWAIGLPITMFAGMIAIATPYGGGLVARYGARRVLLMGCVPAVIGYGMTAMAHSVEAFIVWRACTAIGYAFITIACQGYLAEDAGRHAPGPQHGGFRQRGDDRRGLRHRHRAVLAERVGFRLTFGASALITCGVGLLAYRSMEADAGRRSLSPAVVAKKSNNALLQALSNPRFAGLVVLVAIPAKIVLSGFVFYLTPLYLSGLALSQPAIGRNVMLYGLTMLVTIPLGAVASDRLRATGTVIALAGVATGLGMLAPRYLGPTIAMPIAIALTGLCQGLASAPMLAVVPEICPAEVARSGVATLFGYLRLAERIGSIAGPLLAASLVALVGYINAISTIGLISLATACAYALIAGAFRGPRASPA